MPWHAGSGESNSRSWSGLSEGALQAKRHARRSPRGVTTLEKTERIARRVLGGAHPTTTGIDACERDRAHARRRVMGYFYRRSSIN